MSLSTGQTLGSYRISSRLGAGGMGEVWRATDTRLDRDVALKVLPEGFADDPERHARFEREAKVLASLNHPNIAVLFGLEHLQVHVGAELVSAPCALPRVDEGAGKLPPYAAKHEGDLPGNGQRATGNDVERAPRALHVLVMELVEGEDLAQRISRGAVPLDEAIPIARQIAEALEAAHEHGIVHRDLKPANVKVRPDGTVKVLDFGLAKALDPTGGQAQSDPAHSPTLTAATQAGLILGTAAYMAPEQARGRTVDRRADIWAFGVVLFEMITGRRLFTGELVTDVLANVLKQEIDWNRLPAATPPEVRRLLRRCLERDPKSRLRDIGEARVALAEPVGGEAAAPPPRRERARWIVPAAVGGTLVAVAIAAFLLGRSTSPTSVEDVRLSALTFRRGSVLTARFAPDGGTVVYGAAWDGAPPDVYSARIDSRESRALGLTGADVLGVSSRGELALSLRRRFTIGWESAGTLARMPLDGAAPREVMEGVQDADWSPDGAALAVVRDTGAKRRLEYPVGTVLYETGGWISHARVSRDGRRVAFLDHPNRGDNQASVKVVDTTGAVREIAPSASNGLAWSATADAVLFPTGQALRAATVSGKRRLVFRSMGGIFLHDVAAQGQVLLSRTTMQREIVVQAAGEPRARTLSWLDWSFPTAVSADGDIVLFEEQNLATQGGDYAIFLRRADGSPPVRLGDGRGLALSPDGRWVLASRQAGGTDEMVLFPTGAGETRRLGAAGIVAEAAAFLPDGARVVLGGHAPGEGGRLYVMGLDGTDRRPISPEGVTAYFCALVSPDGELAFATGPDGAVTLYPIAGGEPRRVPGTSLEDIAIRWAADGRSLYVQRRTGLPARVERVDIATGAREPWLELTPPDPAGVHGIGPIHLSSDGRTAVYSYRRKLDQLFVVEGLR